MNQHSRQHLQPLPADILLLVEGIARTLAREDHEQEITRQGLSKAGRVRSDGPPASGVHST